MEEGVKIKTLITTIFIAMLVYSLAFTDAKHMKSIVDVLNEIKTQQGVDENKKINPDKVSENLLEKLGELIMADHHPNQKEHAWMDKMMGGEGSENLKAMHQMMGYRYLEGSMQNGYERGHMMNYKYGRKFGMPGYEHRMKNFENNKESGMGYGYHHNNFFSGWLFWILIILVIIVVVIFITKQFLRKKNSAIDILKERYAKGEINKEQFEQMKKDLSI